MYEIVENIEMTTFISERMAKMRKRPQRSAAHQHALGSLLNAMDQSGGIREDFRRTHQRIST